MCKFISISEFLSCEIGNVSAAVYIVHETPWRSTLCLIPGHVPAHIETEWNEARPSQPAGTIAKLLCFAFAKLFQRTHQDSPWKSHSNLISQFPTLCVRHFQCLFPKNQLAFWLWITQIHIIQKPDWSWFSVLFSFSGSPRTSSLSFNACSSHWEGEFFTSNLLKMFWRNACISRQKDHPSTEARKSNGTVSQKLCRLFWAAQRWVPSTDHGQEHPDLDASTSG